MQEEMGRVLRFLDWHARWWIEQENGRGEGVDACLREGLSAYAHRQASIRIKLKDNFANLWDSVGTWVAEGEVSDPRNGDHSIEVVDDEETRL